MSRCFAYPIPGNTWNEGSGVALIESIKLQTRSELTKAEAKKDRKRDKKERKKEKKEKSNSGLLPEKKINKRSSTAQKIRSLQKLIQSENEQLERSSITEEHAKPVGEQKPSTSSDSTQNSSKRKREASPPPIVKQEQPSIRSNGNVIRIRLSSLKRNAPLSAQEPCSTPSVKAELPSHSGNDVNSRQQPCSTSGRSELATSVKYQESQVNVSSVGRRNTPIISVRPPRIEVDKGSSASGPKLFTKEDNASVVGLLPENKLPKVPLPPKEICSTSGGPKAVTRVDDIAVCELPKGVLPPRPDSKTLGVPKAIAREDDILLRDPKSLNKKMVKADMKYQDLFLNWVPPPPQSEFESDDQDWLFSKKKNPDNQSDKKLRPNNNLSCCSSNALLWPRAQFIPEADIYALPFTVPF